MADGSESIARELKDERIKKAYFQALKAQKSQDKLFLVETFRNSSEIIISFSGSSGSVRDWFSETPFGETKINLSDFPSLRSIGNDEPAFVNKAFLQMFLAVLGKQSFLNEVNEAMEKNKQIVFTGISSGAAVAIFAALWTLDKYITPNTKKVPPLCVTFGSPLVGNHILSHATRREKWTPYFIHFVMKYDIVPRLLLAPLSSFEQRFDPVLQFFITKSKSFMDESIAKNPLTSDFYFAVMTNAASTTSHAACKLMGSTNAAPDMLANFIALSPYRPFGTYVFCTGSGKMIVVRNPDAVLQLLFFSAQLNNVTEAAEVAYKSLREHVLYGDELKGSLARPDVICLDQFEDAATVTALNDLGLTERARLCLQAAGELEKQKASNEEKIKTNAKKAQKHMKSVETYKAMNETQNLGYYDAFKQQINRIDFESNVNRLELASVWDEIIEMLKRYELPDDFEVKAEWVDQGTDFRRLLEPLDIANYYRHVRNDVAGPYMGKGRPRRYRYTQRWLEHLKRKPAGTYSESCFLAQVEELCIRTSKNIPFEVLEEEILKLEGEIKRWNEEKVLSKDVFLEGSTFMKWWKTLPQRHKEKSYIRGLIQV